MSVGGYIGKNEKELQFPRAGQRGGPGRRICGGDSRHQYRSRYFGIGRDIEEQPQWTFDV